MSDEHIRQTLRDLGVSVRYMRLDDNCDGEYLNHRRLIRLQPGLPRR